MVRCKFIIILLATCLCAFATDPLDYAVQIMATSSNTTRLSNLVVYVNGSVTNSLLTRNVEQFTNVWTLGLVGKSSVTWNMTFTNSLAGSNAAWYSYMKVATQDLAGAPELVGGIHVSFHLCPREGTNPPVWGPCNESWRSGYIETNR
jgi:hypothetical protein